ncbi:MAG: putative dynein heavy chain [Streblomastix strix]|uniref:Putative dynein heavy chain n=1 Tax=Streblomastix strix TaxID=222440 RepID=A0A5J4W2W5_9EUKA|nr:MAG: putative dynein heavy chain [Streblomastix strix]
MYETMEVICGQMLVVEPATGKTTCLSTDEKYNNSRLEINKIIDNSFNSAEKYLENKYKKRVRKVEVIRNDFRRMKQWMSDVKMMNISNQARLLTMDARPLKNNLIPIPQNCSDQIKQHLHDLFIEISDHCRKGFSDLSHQLQQLPKQLNEYYDYVVFLQTLHEIHNRLKVSVELLNQMKNLGEEQQTKLTVDEQMVLSNVHTSHKEFKDSLRKAEEYRDSQHNRMIVVLNKEIAKFEQDLTQTHADHGAGIITNETTDPSATLQRLYIVQKSIDQYKDRKGVLERFREIQSVEEIPYPNFIKCMNRFDHRVQIWNYLKKYNKENQQWRSIEITQLNSEDILTTVNQLSRELGIAERKETDDGVVKHLKHIVDDFKPFLPILTKLCQPAMQLRHWKKLFDLMGKKEWQPGVTLTQLTKMGVIQYKQQILEINATANGEYALKVQLSKIKQG